VTHPLRICQYFGALRPDQGPNLLPNQGGVARAVIDLSEALRRAGHEVSVLRSGPRPAITIRSESAGRALMLETSLAAGGLLSRRGLQAAQLALEGADALHLHEVWDPACLQLARLARQTDVPYVMSSHGSLDDYSMGRGTLKKRTYLALAGRRMLQRAAAVHCTAAAERRQSMKWYPKGRPVVVPLLMDLAAFVELPGDGPAIAGLPALDHDLPRLLVLGRIHEKKGIERLIDAAADLAQDGMVCSTVVAGPGDPEYVASLRRRVASRGIENHVAFPGPVSGTAKVSLFQWADLFVLPTHEENWGIVLFEALAAGTPVVTTRGVDVWQELEQTGAATLIGAGPGELTTTMRRLLLDRGELRQVGAAARTKVLQQHSREQAVGRYIDLYRDLARDTTA